MKVCGHDHDVLNVENNQHVNDWGGPLIFSLLLRISSSVRVQVTLLI